MLKLEITLDCERVCIFPSRHDNIKSKYWGPDTVQRESERERERESCLILFLSLSLSLHRLSSTKLIFTLIASDYVLLSKKAPYQTSSRKMEFMSGKGLQAITCSYFIMKIRLQKNSVKHFKTANATDTMQFTPPSIYIYIYIYIWVKQCIKRCSLK